MTTVDGEHEILVRWTVRRRAEELDRIATDRTTCPGRWQTRFEHADEDVEGCNRTREVKLASKTRDDRCPPSVRQYRSLPSETSFKSTFFFLLLLPFNRLAEEKSLLLDRCDYQGENDLFHSSPPRGEIVVSFVLCAITKKESRRIILTWRIEKKCKFTFRRRLSTVTGPVKGERKHSLTDRSDGERQNFCSQNLKISDYLFRFKGLLRGWLEERSRRRQLRDLKKRNETSRVYLSFFRTSLLLLAGQIFRFRHVEHRGPTGRHWVWPKRTILWLIWFHNSLHHRQRSSSIDRFVRLPWHPRFQRETSLFRSFRIVR